MPSLRRLAGWIGPLGKMQRANNLALGGTVTYKTNYNGTGKTYRIHTFTYTGSDQTFKIIKAGQPFNLCTIAGGAGAGGDTGSSNEGSWGGPGGTVTTYTGISLPTASLTVQLTTPGPGGWPAGTNYGGNTILKNGGTTLYSATGSTIGASGPGYWPTTSPGADGTISTISGQSERYAAGGGNKGGAMGAYTISYGNGGTGTSGHPPYAGGSGVLIAAYEADPWYNSASGGTVTEVENYNGTGEVWRIHTFTSASDSLVVHKGDRPFSILVAGRGGDGGQQGGFGNGSGGGAGGLTIDTNKTITAGTYPITIGTGNAASGHTTFMTYDMGGGGVGGRFTQFDCDSAANGGAGHGTGGCGGGGGGDGGDPCGRHPGGSGYTSGGYGDNSCQCGGGGGGAGGNGGTGGTAGAGISSNITGTTLAYSAGGGNNYSGATRSYGSGQTYGSSNLGGAVIVAYRIG